MNYLEGKFKSQINKLESKCKKMEKALQNADKKNIEMIINMEEERRMNNEKRWRICHSGEKPL